MSILLSCYKACFFSFFDQCLESIVYLIYSNQAALPHVVPLPVIKTLTYIKHLLICKSSLGETQQMYIPYEYAKGLCKIILYNSFRDIQQTMVWLCKW